MKKLLQKAQRNNISDLMIVGLGNPGPEYVKTRHNVGFDLVELLSEQLDLFLKKPFFRNYKYASLEREDRIIHLVEPLTYMNRSGDILPFLMKKYGIGSTELIIVCDNMDLPCGRTRMKPRGSSAGHNGLKSVMANLGTGDFYRLYIGVARPLQGQTVVDHVLGSFDEQGRRAVDAALLRTASLISSDPSLSMEGLLNGINANQP